MRGVQKRPSQTIHHQVLRIIGMEVRQPRGLHGGHPCMTHIPVVHCMARHTCCLVHSAGCGTGLGTGEVVKAELVTTVSIRRRTCS